MKRLWIALCLCLIMCVPLSTTEPLTNEGHNQMRITEDTSQSDIKRVYGMNLAPEIYIDASINEYRDFVRTFTENGTRWIMDYSMATEGNNYHARNYIIQQMQELSYNRLEIELIGKHYNIIGRLPGYLPGNHSVFAVSAHYDSPQGSPGANCDGSGIAVVLSLIRIMSQYEWPLDIYFIAFNGLHTQDFMTGSPEVANEFQRRNIDILALYNVDTILVQDSTAPSDERILMGYATGGQQNYHRGQYWAELTRMMSNNYGMNAIVPVPSTSFYLWTRSDHYSFFERGFTNVLCAFESGLSLDESYQGSSDRWDNPSYQYHLGSEVTGVIGASMAFTMSRSYGEPTTLNHVFTLGSGNVKIFYFAVTTPTTVNVSVRWYGGRSTFAIFDPSDTVIASAEYNTTSPWEATDVFSKAVTTKGLYYVLAYNSGYSSVGYDLTFSYDTDIDSNGVLDREEHWLEQSYFETDSDLDELSDAEEIFIGTDRYDSDTDSDLMPDKYEVDMGFDPLDPSDANLDADEDGLSNLQEYQAGTDPFNPDSDFDGMDDLWELENGLNPLVNDADFDPDEDGLSNLEEYQLGTNPQIPEPPPPLDIWILTPILVIVPVVVVLYLRREDIF
ncbi:M28 family peptidase [Candidatus Thorarchaeota archaeon]|nr:MAG: M28 family peptidase [Candidatus Thorarchaeota archaeon]